MSNNIQWTANDIPEQTDRIAIVTGANSGIGYETARILAEKGATVIMACRNLDKANEAACAILSIIQKWQAPRRATNNTADGRCCLLQTRYACRITM